MRTFLLLLVMLTCYAAYIRAQKPATWNLWMTSLGENSYVVPLTPAANDSTGGSSTVLAPQPAPARTYPVGGMLKNGDFSQGDRYWQGDGNTVFGSKGLVVRLRSTSWSRVYQSFSAEQGGVFSIEVTYKFSPGLTVSHDPADYTDISQHLEISGFEKFSSLGMSPGDFYGTIGDPNTTSISCELFSPQLTSTDVQDYQHTYPAVPGSSSITFALAFPPGTGTVTLLTAYVTSH